MSNLHTLLNTKFLLHLIISLSRCILVYKTCRTETNLSLHLARIHNRRFLWYCKTTKTTASHKLLKWRTAPIWNKIKSWDRILDCRAVLLDTSARRWKDHRAIKFDSSISTLYSLNRHCFHDLKHVATKRFICKMTLCNQTNL